MYLRRPLRVIAVMAAAVRPGGTVAVEDADFSACFAYPTCRAFDRWVRWYQATVRRNGGDPRIGRRLPALLRSAGLRDVRLRVVQPADMEGPGSRLVEASMQRTRAAVIAAGVATEEEYDAAHAEVRAFTDDPSTLLAGPRIVQSWGVTPSRCEGAS